MLGRYRPRVNRSTGARHNRELLLPGSAVRSGSTRLAALDGVFLESLIERLSACQASAPFGQPLLGDRQRIEVRPSDI
jgi:hypothetical protein